MDRPKVGVAVFVKNKHGNVISLRRKNAHGNGTWALPGGHVEAGEDPIDTCKREVLEEVGVQIENVCPLTFANVIFEEEDLHYVTLYYVADRKQGEPRILEPDKCDEVRWSCVFDIYEPRFGSLGSIIEWIRENASREGSKCL